jgi:hypothetical protein
MHPVLRRKTPEFVFVASTSLVNFFSAHSNLLAQRLQVILGNSRLLDSSRPYAADSKGTTSAQPEMLFSGEGILSSRSAGPKKLARNALLL